MLLLRLLHLSQQLLLLFVQAGRQLHVIGNHQITEGAVAPVVTLAAHTNLRAVLGLWLNLQLNLRTIAQRDDSFATKQGCVHVDVHVHVHLAIVGSGTLTTAAAVAAASSEISTSTIASVGSSAETSEATEAACTSTAAKAAETSALLTATGTTAAEEIFEEAGESASAISETAEVEALERISSGSASTTGSTSESASTEATGVLPVFAKLIILGALIRVGNHLVCLVQRLELSLRLRVIRVQSEK